jgi:hypothetical protein
MRGEMGERATPELAVTAPILDGWLAIDGTRIYSINLDTGTVVRVH